jgi:hypothetical protein
MKMFVVVACAVVVAFASLFSGEASSQDGATPSIKDVMNKLHKGATSPLAKLKTQLSAPSPDWGTLEKETKDFVILGAALAKNDPPKGEKASWIKLSDAYFEDAKALDSAVKAHDVAAAKAAHGKLAASCKSCHGAHKGKAR